MKRQYSDWEVYERLIARLVADQLSTDLCVTANARVVGRITGISRQVDVLIDARHDTDNSRRIIVDAKKRRKKLDVGDVEAFRGFMEDVGATHGYLVCSAGYTKAAEKRAQMAVTIRIVPLDRMEGFDPRTWPRCQKPRCVDGRVFWDGYPELSLRVRPTQNVESGATQLVRFVHYVGKCDRCGAFHVRCVTCDVVLHVPEGGDDDCGHQCRCKLPWFWLASVEQDNEGRNSAELHAVIGVGNVITVDRRPVP